MKQKIEGGKKNTVIVGNKQYLEFDKEDFQEKFSVKYCQSCGEPLPRDFVMTPSMVEEAQMIWKKQDLEDGISFICDPCFKEYRRINKDRLKIISNDGL